MSAVSDLVFRFFELCTMKPIEIRRGIFQIQITDELAKELDGWRAKGGLFQFTFDKKLAETYGAELISSGSYRLDSIIQVIQKQAIISSGSVSHDIFYEPVIRRKLIEKLSLYQPGFRWYVLDHKCKFGPYFWFTLRLTYLAYEKKEEVRKVLVDLSSGKVVSHEIPAELIEQGAPTDQEIYKRKLSFKQAYRCVQKELTNELQYANSGWAKTANETLMEEQQRLEDYFKDSPESAERNQRITELMERARPRVQIRPLRGAFLYLPKFDYRMMQVGQSEKVKQIIYDPVSNQWDFLENMA